MKKYLFALVVFSLLLTGCSTDKKEEVVKKTEYALGETAEIKNLKMTVNSTRIDEGDGVFSPDEGTQWIAIEVTFENTGDESQYIAGIFDITLKDEEGREKDQSIWGSTTGSLDGDVLAGEKLTGEKSFIITGEEEHLYLYYKASFSSDDPIKVIIK